MKTLPATGTTAVGSSFSIGGSGVDGLPNLGGFDFLGDPVSDHA